MEQYLVEILAIGGGGFATTIAVLLNKFRSKFEVLTTEIATYKNLLNGISIDTMEIRSLCNAISSNTKSTQNEVAEIKKDIELFKEFATQNTKFIMDELEPKLDAIKEIQLDSLSASKCSELLIDISKKLDAILEKEVNCPFSSKNRTKKEKVEKNVAEVEAKTETEAN
jgi:archaellum component FlaC